LVNSTKEKRRKKSLKQKYVLTVNQKFQKMQQSVHSVQAM